MDKIKLIIWDLDETFWNGTLSEEGVEVVHSNIQILKTLTERGIINSIVSKNTFEDAKRKLQEYEVWDYFVFPAISWEPKGELIKQVIAKCQLRAPNVLFIDDNVMNLKEASFYNEGIHTSLPDILDGLLEHPSCQGKDDRSLSRLKQYKVLEKKAVDQIQYSDNSDFLKASEIKLSYFPINSENESRIFELIERTNQLNYTKIRLSYDEFSDLTQSTKYEQKAIYVTDKYGDYGIVGYYCLDCHSHRLKHFIFSCRILNLGVEQYVYAQLGFPNITVVPEVAIELSNSECPSWIECVSSEPVSLSMEPKEKHTKIFFKGGCDLAQMMFYLKAYNIDVIEETNYVGDNNFPIHVEHSQMILDSLYLSNAEKSKLASSIPFLDEKSYRTEIFSYEKYDILVYSVLMDYTQEIYENVETGVKIPFGDYSVSLTDKENRCQIIEKYKARNIEGVDASFLDSFQTSYVNKGQISPENFKDNLLKMRKEINSSIPIVFVNGSEVSDAPNVKEIKAQRRHIEMNKVLEQFVKKNENCFLLDVRKRVYSVEHITDNIRHYKREIYHQLSDDLVNLLNKIDGFQVKTKLFSIMSLLALLMKLKPVSYSVHLGRKITKRVFNIKI